MNTISSPLPFFPLSEEVARTPFFFFFSFFSLPLPISRTVTFSPSGHYHVVQGQLLFFFPQGALGRPGTGDPPLLFFFPLRGNELHVFPFFFFFFPTKNRRPLFASSFPFFSFFGPKNCFFSLFFLLRHAGRAGGAGAFFNFLSQAGSLVDFFSFLFFLPGSHERGPPTRGIHSLSSFPPC